MLPGFSVCSRTGTFTKFPVCLLRRWFASRRALCYRALFSAFFPFLCHILKIIMYLWICVQFKAARGAKQGVLKGTPSKPRSANAEMHQRHKYGFFRTRYSV